VQTGAIGQAPNPANNIYLALEAYKYSVPNTESTLPSSFCATCSPTTVGPVDTWGPRALAELIERLGGAILSGHSKAATPLLHTVRILKEHGKLDLLKGMIIPEGAGFSPSGLLAAGLVGSDFAKLPFLLVPGDGRPLATRIGNRAARGLSHPRPAPS